MGQGLLEIERLQNAHCDWSRGTRKGHRILRNVGEVARFFPSEEPLLCFGCGDGLEVEAWKLLGYDAVGCEISKEKSAKAEVFGVRIMSQKALGVYSLNVYCAHTIEHVVDAKAILEWFSKIALSTVCIICPIEPNGSRNPSHLSPVRALTDIMVPGMKVVQMIERYNDEPEGLIVFKRIGEANV